MESEMKYKKLSTRHAIYSLIFMIICILLEAGVHGGGTGDIDEGEFFILFYLIIKGIIAFVRGGVGITYGYLTKKNISTNAILWTVYSVILLSAIFIKNAVVGVTSYPYETGFVGVNTSIMIMIADCGIFLFYSIITSIMAAKRNEDSFILALTSNAILCVLFVSAFFTGIIGNFVS